MTTAAAACAPCAQGSVSTVTESESKLHLSVMALPDRNAINGRILAVVRSIMESLEADAKQEIDLDAYKQKVVELKSLFERRHAIEKLGKNESCHCKKIIRFSLAILNRISLAQRIIADQPDNKSLAAASVYRIGKANHLRTVKGTLAAFVSSLNFERLTHDDVCPPGEFRSRPIADLDSNFIRLEKKMKEIAQNCKASTTKKDEALEKQLTIAVVQADPEKLEQLLHTAGDFAIEKPLPKARASLFEIALKLYSRLPKLEERHFHTLDFLVRAGSDIRACSSREGFYCMLTIEPRSESSAAQLIEYLHRNGYSFEEEDEGPWPAFYFEHYHRECTSILITETMLRLGLRLPGRRYLGGHGVSEFMDQTNIIARLLIGDGALDKEGAEDPDLQKFFSKVRNRAREEGIEFSGISDTFRATINARRQLLSEVREKTGTPAETRQTLSDFSWNQHDYFPPPICGLISDFAVVTEDQIPYLVWKTVEDKQERKKRDATAAAGAAAAPEPKKPNN